MTARSSGVLQTQPGFHVPTNESALVKKVGWQFLALALSACNRDVENGRIYGTVTDRRTHEPRAGVVLRIRTAYYRGGDYDSYNGYENRTAVTDQAGNYAVDFDRACYVQIKIARGKGDTVAYYSALFQQQTEANLVL